METVVDDGGHGELLSSFVPAEVIAQDAKAKTITLHGTINGQTAILLAEKTSFNADRLDLIYAPAQVHTDVVNDIYHKYFAVLSGDAQRNPGAKYSLIYPATETHLQKYKSQKRRIIAETQELYEAVVSPYIDTMIGSRLDWVRNILAHKSEQDRILYEDTDPVHGFILLPDLKWDGTTLASLYFLCIVHRTDIHSIRDLRATHIPFLIHLHEACLDALTRAYYTPRGLVDEADTVRIYLHYQPSYYHFHLHVHTTAHEAGDGQAIGKAHLLLDVIETLRRDGEAYAERTMYYTLGEDAELYRLIQAHRAP